MGSPFDRKLDVEINGIIGTATVLIYASGTAAFGFPAVSFLASYADDQHFSHAGNELDFLGFIYTREFFVGRLEKNETTIYQRKMGNRRLAMQHTFLIANR